MSLKLRKTVTRFLSLEAIDKNAKFEYDLERGGRTACKMILILSTPAS